MPGRLYMTDSRIARVLLQEDQVYENSPIFSSRLHGSALFFESEGDMGRGQSWSEPIYKCKGNYGLMDLMT